MTHANKQRMTLEGERMKNEAIDITQYWEEQLAAMPYLSRKSPFPYFSSPISIFVQRRTARRSTC